MLADTHTWVWWVTDSDRLSRSARAALAKAVRGPGLLVSAISCWEVAMLVSKGRLGLGADTDEWIDRALAAPGIRLVPLEPRIAVLSTRLSGTPPSDPADQILIATALVHTVPIVTRDDEIRKYGRVTVVW
jgi:PIN domain nuclease of toxin-antitoxin system